MIVARRLAPSARPPPLQDTERVTEMLILGVILRGDVLASSHVHRVLSLCNGSLHALCVLCWHGLSAEALSTVTEATIISRLLYSDVAFPEKYVTENFHEIFRKIFGNFPLNRKNIFIYNVSMKTAENTGKLLHSFKS